MSDTNGLQNNTVTAEPNKTILTNSMDPYQASDSPATDPTNNADPNKTAGEPAQKEPDKKEPQGAPEQYTDFTMPAEMTADPEIMEAFKSVCKSLNLTQEQAQSLIDLEIKNMQRYNENVRAAFEKQVDDWAEQTKKELGMHYEQKVAVGVRALQKYGTPELANLLNETGLGNHPEIVKFFIRVGETVSEDNFLAGKTSRQNVPLEKRLFPDLK